MENTGGLYRSEYEHDACGVGFIAHIKGQKSHSIVSQALEVLKNLRHRGAVGADPLQATVLASSFRFRISSIATT